MHFYNYHFQSTTFDSYFFVKCMESVWDHPNNSDFLGILKIFKSDTSCVTLEVNTAMCTMLNDQKRKKKSYSNACLGCCTITSKTKINFIHSRSPKRPSQL